MLAHTRAQHCVQPLRQAPAATTQQTTIHACLANIRAQHSIEPQRQAADTRTHKASILCCLTQESNITSGHKGKQQLQAHSDQLGWFTQEPSIASSHKGKQHLHAQSKHLCNVGLREIRALHVQGKFPNLFHETHRAR